MKLSNNSLIQGDFCVIRSCLDTLRKQGLGMLEVLLRAFNGNPIQIAA